MKCRDAQQLFSSFMDHAMSGKQMRTIGEHLRNCSECRTEFALLSNTQEMVARLGRKPAPANLALKLRVMISQEAAHARRNPIEVWLLRLENAFNAFMVPATAGMVSAIIIFGLLIGVLMPGQLSAANDVPTGLYTPPELAFSPFGMETGWVNTDSLVVEAFVDANGRVQDYRILSTPEVAKDITPELKNMMIFTVFKPATSFGQPTSGRAILSFAKINVKG
ncbi:MAG TPA: anti-sigma factor [Clostridia bacterium]|nr:anti-sigma factor [Clostridia bacterium]